MFFTFTKIITYIFFVCLGVLFIKHLAKKEAAKEEAARLALLAEKTAKENEDKIPTVGTLIKTFCQGTEKIAVTADGKGGFLVNVVDLYNQHCIDLSTGAVSDYDYNQAKIEIDNLLTDIDKRLKAHYG